MTTLAATFAPRHGIRRFADLPARRREGWLRRGACTCCAMVLALVTPNLPVRAYANVSMATAREGDLVTSAAGTSPRLAAQASLRFVVIIPARMALSIDGRRSGTPWRSQTNQARQGLQTIVDYAADPPTVTLALP